VTSIERGKGKKPLKCGHFDLISYISFQHLAKTKFGTVNTGRSKESVSKTLHLCWPTARRAARLVVSV
jgi:hypothetical protein